MYRSLLPHWIHSDRNVFKLHHTNIGKISDGFRTGNDANHTQCLYCWSDKSGNFSFFLIHYFFKNLKSTVCFHFQEYRGVLGVLPNLFCQLGIFITYVVGQWLDWSQLALACKQNILLAFFLEILHDVPKKIVLPTKTMNSIYLFFFLSRSFECSIFCGCVLHSRISMLLTIKRPGTKSRKHS